MIAVMYLTGSLGLFLYGMKIMSEGIAQAAGQKMQSFLEIFTKNKWISMLVGTFFTALIQSTNGSTVLMMSFVNGGLLELSQIPAAFHSKLRLAVIAALLSGPKNFRALQDLTGATPGNLGKQLEVLEAEGYLRSEKAFVGRRPNTTYTLLPYGREQFAQYVALLESLLAGAQGEEDTDSPS